MGMVVQSTPKKEDIPETPSKTSTKKKFVYDMISRLLGWEMEAYDARRSQFAQDSVSGKTLSFWFVTACSNSFAVAFGLKAALFGVHPKFYLSRLMVRSIAFHIIVGSLEFV